MDVKELNEKYSLNVELNEDYRLVSDGRQYILLRRHIVDPTKSPTYDPDKHSDELRESWREEAYYPLRSSGLVAAVERVVMKKVAVAGEVSISELIRTIHELRREISDKISAK